MGCRDFKLVILGTSGVGKSAITIRYVMNTFCSTYDPTIEESYRKVVDIDDNQYMLEILDTAGTEQFTSIRDIYMRNGDCFILVYSIVCRQSLDYLYELYPKLLRVRESDSAINVVAGNKIDLNDQRKIQEYEGRDFSKTTKGDFMECSAKDNINIAKIFEECLKKVINALPEDKKKKKGCIIF